MALSTTVKLIQLLAAACGVAGTVLLYFASFGLEARPFYSDTDLLKKMAERNEQRLWRQRLGLEFLLISFLLGGIGVALS
jgi:hypothetical protein